MTSGIDKRKVLGKGLSALLPQRPREAESTAAAAAAPAPMQAPSAPTTLPLDQIHPNPLQPRVVFQAEHVMSADQPVGHAVYPCTRADLGQLARELAVAGEAGGAHG